MTALSAAISGVVLLLNLRFLCIVLGHQEKVFDQQKQTSGALMLRHALQPAQRCQKVVAGCWS